MVQTLVQSLDSLENDTGAEPTSMKYQAALADQVPYCPPSSNHRKIQLLLFDYLLVIFFETHEDTNI